MDSRKDHNLNRVTLPFQRLPMRSVLLVTLIMASIFVFTSMLIGSQTITAEDESSEREICLEEIKKLCTECYDLMAEIGIDCSKVLMQLKCLPKVPENHWKGEYYKGGELVRIKDDGDGRGFTVRFYTGHEISSELPECIVGKPQRVSWTKTVVSKGGEWSFWIRKPNKQRFGGGITSSRYKVSINGVSYRDRTNLDTQDSFSFVLQEGEHTIQVDYWPLMVGGSGEFHFGYNGPEELPPAAPSLTAAYITESELVQLNWINNSDDEVNFELERRSGTSGWKILIKPGPEETSHNDEDLIIPGVVYNYRIKATNLTGLSAYSNTAKVTAGTSPAAPSGLKATLISPGGDGIELTWINNSRYDVWFELQIQDESTHEIESMGLPMNKTVYQHFAAKRGNTYEYRVRAKSNWGTSEWCRSATISVPEITEKPDEPEPTPVAAGLEILDSGSPIIGEPLVKSNYSGKQGRAVQYSNSKNLALRPEAQPAVASTTIAGYTDIHKPEFVNDGYYGNGSSWIGTSKNGWIKIDLGAVMSFNRVQFGRDRTENGYSDRNPGHFIIFVANSDPAYKNGNSDNDSSEYQVIFNSTEHEFGRIIRSPQSVLVSFPTVTAQFIKLQFTNPDAAIDEVEVW